MPTEKLYFEFENYEQYDDDDAPKQYMIWLETIGDNECEYWQSANAGFSLTNLYKPYNTFPTYPIKGDEAYKGSSVALTTRSTGDLGAMAGMPIAAGNFFIGEFDGEGAMFDALGCTRFGRPINKKPVQVSGMYKYKSGGESMKPVKGQPGKFEGTGKNDTGAMYAVFYRNHDEKGKKVVLTGHNVRNSDMIVAKANVGNVVTDTNGWEQFVFDFEYDQSKTIDANVLKDYGYSIAVVFSSSSEGETYTGAVGSTLCIDNVRITCE
ncbi:MAG: PCMD domain-containing protein [Bacteroidales bacterium]|nr:PCMD domain-containing protein [Bacteroidales bacterium]